MNEHSNILLYSQEAEEALLGSALIDPGVLRETDISPSDFFIQRNGMIWAALLSLDKGHGGLDILSLSEVCPGETNWIRWAEIVTWLA